jgi:DNA-binding CsgD family transcriptional regulator
MAHRIDDGFENSHRHQRLDVADVQALLRLCTALHANGEEPEERKLQLLQALRKLIDADRASASVATFGGAANGDGGGRRGRNKVGAAASAAAAMGSAAPACVVSVVHAASPTRRGAAAGAGAKQASAPMTPSAVERGDPCPWQVYHTHQRNRRRRPRARGAGAAGTEVVVPGWCTAGSTPLLAVATARRGKAKRGRGHYVHSFLSLADGRLVACLTVGRDPGRPRFTGRDRSIVCTLHPEVAWVYRTDVALVSPDTRALPQRVRETLQHLLAGKGEKQIAAAMGLSHNTIHHYVKALHKHFGVSSRSELLARWVAR